MLDISSLFISHEKTFHTFPSLFCKIAPKIAPKIQHSKLKRKIPDLGLLGLGETPACC